MSEKTSLIEKEPIKHKGDSSFKRELMIFIGLEKKKGYDIRGHKEEEMKHLNKYFDKNK